VPIELLSPIAPKPVRAAAGRRWRRCSSRSKPLLLDSLPRGSAGRLGSQTQLRGLGCIEALHSREWLPQWISTGRAMASADSWS
jgi:hypothetical protein